MKHIKSFKVYEAIITPEFKNMSDVNYISNFDELKKFAEDNGFIALDYDEFINYLDESNKHTAPFKNQSPFFAFYDHKTEKPVFVVNSKREVSLSFFQHILNKEISNIITHELIHKGQNQKSKIEYKLPDPKYKKEYFSDKNEVMAFSYSIAKSLYDTFESNDIKFLFNQINKNETYPLSKLWIDIVRNCDDNIIKRYKKYIYLYLEKIIDKNETH